MSHQDEESQPIEDPGEGDDKPADREVEGEVEQDQDQDLETNEVENENKNDEGENEAGLYRAQIRQCYEKGCIQRKWTS